jgi:hypothetical protein
LQFLFDKSDQKEMAFASRFKRLLAAAPLAAALFSATMIGLAPIHPSFAVESSSFLPATVVHAANDADMVDIVFDLDDTLIRWVRAFPDEHLPSNAIAPDGGALKHSYRVLDGATELLQSLANRPNVRISFFSLGPLPRNEAVLKKIILPNGKSAWDIAHKVLSDQDATSNGEKDLTKINPDLSRVLIVDDKFNSTIVGQRKNVIRISPKVRYFYESVDQKWAEEDRSRGITPEQFIQNRNKLAYAEGILSGMFDAVETKHISPLKAATQIQYSYDTHGKSVYRENLMSDLRLYRKGAADFHAVNPYYHFTTIHTYDPLAMIRCMSLGMTGK